MSSLEPIDLLDRVRLGQQALVNLLDPTERHLPYWNADYANGDLVHLRGHGAWVRCHDVPRAIHGLGMAQDVTGEPVGPQVFDDLAGHLYGLFQDDDPLPGTLDDETGRRFVSLHNIREVIHALTALIKRGDNRAELRARTMIRTLLAAMNRDGRIDLDRLPPSCQNAGPRTWQPHEEGRAVDALVRYARVSGDAAAVELAALMVRYALNHCFTPTGTITQEAGTHGHSITALVAGLADFARLTCDANILAQVKRIYDVGLPRFNSSFGWSMECLDKYVYAPHHPDHPQHGHIYRGESNNTGDLVRAAIVLGYGGFSNCFEDAERILRSHLLPSQLVDVAGFSNNPHARDDRLRSLADRVKGSFSFPTPNEILYWADGQLATYDITSGAVDALCEAWQAVAIPDAMGIRVNLLFDINRDGLQFRSLLSREGRIDAVIPAAKNLLVRIPSWAGKGNVTIRGNGTAIPPVFLGDYLIVPADAGTGSIRICFPVRSVRTVESMAYKRYTIDWRGDQIVAMSPAGKFLPMFPPCT